MNKNKSILRQFKSLVVIVGIFLLMVNTALGGPVEKTQIGLTIVSGMVLGGVHKPLGQAQVDDFVVEIGQAHSERLESLSMVNSYVKRAPLEKLTECQLDDIIHIDSDVITPEVVDLGDLEVTGFKSFIHYKENNDERYKAYSELYPELLDNTVITYVNIGLDRSFYSDMNVIEDPSSTLVLVNKYNVLSPDFAPSDFIGVARSLKLSKEAQGYFDLMKLDASRVGINLIVVSGYRSYSVQNELYEGYKLKDPKNVDTFSARPGSSEHQTGLAADINTASSSAKFENTKAYAWMLENAHKYGFILRYPQGKEAITGYKFEPWHWRYVGEQVAIILKESGLTFEEYVGMLSGEMEVSD